MCTENQPYCKCCLRFKLIRVNLSISSQRLVSMNEQGIYKLIPQWEPWNLRYRTCNMSIQITPLTLWKFYACISQCRRPAWWLTRCNTWWLTQQLTWRGRLSSQPRLCLNDAAFTYAFRTAVYVERTACNFRRSWSIFTTQMKRRIYAAFCRTF